MPGQACETLYGKIGILKRRNRTKSWIESFTIYHQVELGPESVLEFSSPSEHQILTFFKKGPPILGVPIPNIRGSLILGVDP